MGHNVCVHQATADGWTDGSPDLRVAFHHSLRDAFGLCVGENKLSDVHLHVEGRAADGGAGCDGWLAVFPDGE